MPYGDGGTYGSTLVYGSDAEPAPVPPSPPFQKPLYPNDYGHDGKCLCRSTKWRYEACDIITGRVKAVLHPVSANWDEKESAFGNGSMVLASQDLRPDNVFPHTTTIYISQVIDGVRVGRYAGIVEGYNSIAGGAATVSMLGVDSYLHKRNLADEDSGIGLTFTQSPQTEIARVLASNALAAGGINLTPTAGVGAIRRDRTYNEWDVKNIGEAIKQLTEVIDGVKYRLFHTYTQSSSDTEAGVWNTEIRFLDKAGEDRGIKLLGGREGATYSVTVDAKDHATWAYGIGEGEEKQQKISVAYDEAGIYPRFHAVPAWKDVSIQSTLDAHTAGYVANHRDPVAIPSMSIPGLEPSPEDLQLGDRVWVQFDYGLTSFKGFCKILSISWAMSDGSPLFRTFGFEPEIRPGDGIRTQDPIIPPPVPPPPGTTSPEPKAGVVSRMTDPRITESSGLTHSKDY